MNFPPLFLKKGRDGVSELNVLAIDQARHGAWAVYCCEEKKLLDYGTWEFDSRKYPFDQAVLEIEKIIAGVIQTHEITAVLIEDIQLRKNVLSFKRLAQLQGVLINLCEKMNIDYNLVAPTQWQNYCKARGRTAKEIKANTKEIEESVQKPSSKILSIQFVQNQFGIETENDNLSDAICIGFYGVNTILTEREESFDG